ncbi:hypothetical protein HOU08_gp298 [Dickeya phage vB_DsoM_JA29]|uniref:Uncharacterized protein n=1 Tax=Dickeya phage vB_DsoM_JA29 TaxID=2283031 RepID=A0A384ZXR5_9CAUD|nr:hypothetical protein HOU08_gp298 [Dickeya phage vB_DsoM_JA29]AXG67024.1 hypothetical protein JA29_298 [Dickeya phage vB_DsoM_JA29]
MPNNKTSVPSRKEFAATRAAAKMKSAPASVRAKNSTKGVGRETDADRLDKFVVAVLEEWRVAKENNLEGSDQNIIKVSMREINLLMSRSLKNTRVSRLHDLINDTLSGLNIVDVYGSWVFVDWDSPDCLFIKLPETSTNALRVSISFPKGSSDYSFRKSTEKLIEHGFGGDDEDDDQTVVDDGDIDREYDRRPENVRKTEKQLRSWTLEQLQNFVIENKIEVWAGADSNYETLLVAVLDFKTKQA